MFYNRICRCFLLLVTISSACRHRSEPKPPMEFTPTDSSSTDSTDQTKQQEKNVPPSSIKGEVLPLEGMRLTSFSAYDASERCMALEDFSNSFARQYGREASIQNWTCRKELFTQDLQLTADFQLIQQEKQAQLGYRINLSESDLTLQFSVDSGGFSDEVYSKKLGEISPKLGNWEASLRDFLKNPNAERKIFGRPFHEFVEAVIQDLNNQGLSLKAKDGTGHVMKVKLNPGENKASGKVHFNEVPAPLFATPPADPAEIPAGTTPISPTFGVLGCSDLACLNDGSVAYQIADEAISIKREIPATGSIRQTRFLVTSYKSFPAATQP